MMMLDLDKHTVEVDCPQCGFYNPITLKQVRLRDAVICRGCKSTIRLEDHMNETRKAIRSVNRALQELEEQFRSLGKITIRI